jgi:hypothetical protein
MDSIKSAAADVIGPSYNYANHILDPITLKVSNNGTMEALWKDMGATAAYVDTLTFGERVTSGLFGAPEQSPLGNKYFIKSGTCGDDSKEECKGKDRYIYIDNVPNGKIPCLDQIGIKLPGTNFRGLVPGLLGDLAVINPIAIFNSLAGKGDISSKCEIRTEPVGYEGNYTNVSKCSPPTPPVQCLPNFSENFQNKEIKENRREKYFLMIFLIIIFCIIFLYNK